MWKLDTGELQLRTKMSKSAKDIRARAVKWGLPQSSSSSGSSRGRRETMRVFLICLCSGPK